ncbi:MAG: methylmalonyl Co-A mutase-associated GTPase MeaB [Candidatus Marinimicrobia bacterium]|nr:methylmalonyl Co-A mutase-associated GTPase MeaB [Candidatus Neomarinimicrobiota bacterium]
MRAKDKNRNRDKNQDERPENERSYRPDWAPPEDHEAFAVKVVRSGYSAGIRKETVKGPRRKNLSVDDYVKGVLKGDRPLLARTITLIESQAPRHRDMAARVLHQLLPYAGKSLRIGVSGVPGAGKSTFIEAFGLQLVQNGHRVAVLAVDPSSSVTKGSILGDKTRMEKLSRDENAFIRPSPSGGTLGGVASKTRESITVCEAAGYDVILVETVGVGQSEITVRSMVDFFLLLQISGAGDELQGIKKGVIEIADAVVINKADSDNFQKAEMTRNQFETAIHYLKPVTKGWNCKVLTCSALTGYGIPEIRRMIWDFKKKTTENGVFQNRRKEQAVNWFYSMVEERMRVWFYDHPEIREDINTMKEKIESGTLLPTTGAEQLMKGFLENISPKKEE